MSLALAVLCAAISSASPRVLTVRGESTGVDSATMSAVLADVEARLASVKLEVVRADGKCEAKAECLRGEAERAGARAVLSVSVFRGPRSVTVDLDARTPAGAPLEVLTTNLAPGETRLSGESATFFEALARTLLQADRPIEPKLEPRLQAEPTPGVSPPRAVSPGVPLLLAGGGLLAASLGLIIAGAVSGSQLDARLREPGVIQGLTREQAQSQANVANALGTASLISCLVGLGVAGAGGVVLLVNAQPQEGAESP